LFKYLMRKDVILGFLTLIAALWIYVTSNHFPIPLGNKVVGPATFPKVISYFLAVLGVIIAIGGILTKSPSTIDFTKMDKKDITKLIASVITVILFSIGIKLKLFIISSVICLLLFIFLTGAEWNIKDKKFLLHLFYSVIITICIYFIFGEFLHVDL